MRKFFSEYGKIIISSILIIAILVFSTPYGQSITGAISQFVNGIGNKMELAMVPAYKNYTVVQHGNDGKSLSKGTVIQLNDLASNNQYRIIAEKGDGCYQVLCTGQIKNNIWWPVGGNTVQCIYMDNGYCIRYKNSYIDNDLTSYYNNLPDTVKRSIIPQEIYQSMITISTVNEETQNDYDFVVHAKENFTASDTDYSTTYGYNIMEKTKIGEKYIYLIDLEDIIAYFAGEATAQDMNTLFINSNNSAHYSYRSWLRSGIQNKKTALSHFTEFGHLADIQANNSYYHVYGEKPSFVIKLEGLDI